MLHPSGVVKSSTSFGWGKGGKVTAAIWHVIGCGGEVISIKCPMHTFTFLLLLLLLLLTREAEITRAESCRRLRWTSPADQRQAELVIGTVCMSADQPSTVVSAP